MQKLHFPRRFAFVFIALVCLLLTESSTARAEGYQLSQNLQPNQTLANYQVSSDGKYAVYQIDSFDENFNQSSQLFSVNTANAQRRAITPVIGDGKFLSSFQITPDSQFVVYSASLEALFRAELYSIPIYAANQNQRRNIGNVPANSEADIFNFYISPNSNHVVYQFRDENAAGEDFEILYRVAPTGGATTQLTPRVPDGEASDVIFAPDSSRIVYEYDSPANDNTLYQSVAINGTGRKTLTDELSGGAEPRITNDSQRFVFTADFTSEDDNISENGLYSIALAGSGTRKQLSRSGEDVYNFEFANGFPVVVYAFKPTSEEGFSPTSFGFVAADKSFESISYDTGKAIETYSFEVSPDNRSVIYIAAAESFGPTQLYSLTYEDSGALDRQLSITANGVFSSVSDFKIAPNSQRIVFRGTQDGDFAPDLFSVQNSNNPAAVKLNNLAGESGANAAFNGVNTYFITPNSQRVIFTYPPDDGSCCGNDLFTNSIAGGNPTGPFATKANDDSFGSVPILTANSRRVVYTKTVFDEFGNGSTTLWAANVP